jgi:type I restriction enzyme M protein
VLTNPPFGVRGANQAPERDDFVVETSNKQLNFLQHVFTVLKPGGRAAIVLPDNCLFSDQAGEVLRKLTPYASFHTVLRLPRGTFTPYSPGTKTNVIFMTKGLPTAETWIYDARSNVPAITKKDRPLSASHFSGFERCYGADPNGRSGRSTADSPDDRWRRFELAELEGRGFKVDSLRWLKDDADDDEGELPEPDELLADLVAELSIALEELTELSARFGESTQPQDVASSYAGGVR